MAFKKEIKLRKVPLTSLIDVIFLLLIFFLVSSLEGFLKASGEISNESGVPNEAEELPKPVSTIQPDPEKPFPDLLIRIQKVGENDSIGDSLEFYLLDKFVKTVKNTKEDTTTIYFGAAHNYRERRGPYSLQMKNGEVILDGIKKIADRIDFIKKQLTPYPEIEISAFRKTKFGSIVQIFKICRERDIREVKFWVIKGREKVSGKGEI